MEVGLLIEIPGGSQANYERVMQLLGLDSPTGRWPDGVISHVAGPTEGGWRVVDVWESEAKFERFLAEQLLTATRQAGTPPFEPRTFLVHNRWPA